jgi:DNA polymerase
VTRDRGRFMQSALAPYVLATVHPSALLRAPPERRDEELARFVADLRKVAEVLD